MQLGFRKQETCHGYTLHWLQLGKAELYFTGRFQWHLVDRGNVVTTGLPLFTIRWSRY
jgi:hypothetical protein